jgi:hypothetical protein
MGSTNDHNFLDLPLFYIRTDLSEALSPQNMVTHVDPVFPRSQRGEPTTVKFSRQFLSTPVGDDDCFRLERHFSLALLYRLEGTGATAANPVFEDDLDLFSNCSGYYVTVR